MKEFVGGRELGREPHFKSKEKREREREKERKRERDGRTLRLKSLK